MAKIKVTAKAEKFRRAGFEFTKTAKEIDVDEKTLAALKAEPMLIVEPAEAKKEDKKDKK